VHHRSRLDWGNAFMVTVADPAASDPQTQVMNAQIINAVQRLPEAQRVVMLLVAVEGLSYQEAADVLDVPIDTVMSRLSRARQAIGAQFDTRDRQDTSKVKATLTSPLRPPEIESSTIITVQRPDLCEQEMRLRRPASPVKFVDNHLSHENHSQA
jgi:hypothetical protein